MAARADRPLAVALDWITAHCVIPDRDQLGQPFVLFDEQFRFLAAHYRVRGTAKAGDLAPAFVYRRSQCVAPQKAGKSPLEAAQVCLEGVGPALFTWWADGGEVYDCRDHGCGCGWWYEYEPGEPMGRPWPTPLIQITATSEEQTDNIYDALRPMITLGPLTDVITKTGEEFIRLPNGGRIDVVTSSARSRLGQRVTFVPQDEALALDTPLPTPTGSVSMGAVSVGDWLIGADGQPTRVVKVTPTQVGRRCFRVRFPDGTSVVASDGHRWLTRVAESAALPKVRTTGEMVADGRRFRAPAPQPYDLPARELPVDPYFLGVWLGDGSTGKAEITCGDSDVADLRAQLAAVGVETRERRTPNRAPTLTFSRKAGFQGSARPAVAQALQQMPCYQSKHIPEAYFRASIEQRTALLQGLMDTDGHVTETGFCTFAGNDRLTADVQRLLRTLGLPVRRVRHADPRARTGEGWKVNFTPRDNLQPFRLARKAARVRPAWCGSDWITLEIEEVPSVPVRCVAVDAVDHLFLAGEGGHVTHNTGLWTPTSGMVSVAETQRRGLAGMGGRAVEITNAWDPAENSVAQRTAESRRPDIYRQHVQAPANLSYLDKRERHRIHRIVYKGWWGERNLASIEAEAAELLETDPAQAERFFGNRLSRGAGAYYPDGLWESSQADPLIAVPKGADVCLGFDGSDSDDWTAIRAETINGYRFTPRYGPDRRPTVWNPAEWGGSIPRGEVMAAMDELVTTFRVRQAFCDPPDWRSEIGEWSVKHGDEKFFEWWTNRRAAMHEALQRNLIDLRTGRSTHDDCPLAAQGAANARKVAQPAQRYILGKPSQHQKIDVTMADVLAHEAACDAREGGWKPRPAPTVPRRIR